MRPIALFLAAGLALAQDNSWSRWVKPKFECYDPSTGLAHFGYFAKTKLVEEAFTLPYTIIPAASAVSPTWTFLTGCWSDAIVAAVNPPTNPKNKVGLQVGRNTAWVNFQKVCSSNSKRLEDADGEIECPVLDNCLASFVACTSPCTGSDIPVYKDGACSCVPSAIVDLSFSVAYQLGGPEEVVQAFGMSNSIVNTLMADPATPFSSGLKPLFAKTIAETVTAAASQPNSPLELIQCVLPSDVTVLPAAVGAYAVKVSLSVKATTSITEATLRDFLQTTNSQTNAWQLTLASAETDICSAQIIPQPGSQDYTTGCSQPNINCDAWPTASYVFSTGYAYPVDFSCVSGGPQLFSYGTAFAALIDEQGRVSMEASAKMGETRTDTSYLGLSPVYVVVAVAVVAALALASVGAVVIHRRRQVQGDDFTQDTQESGWVSANKASLEGRTRAAGLD